MLSVDGSSEARRRMIAEVLRCGNLQDRDGPERD